MDTYSVETQNLGRVYKLRGGKKGEAKTLGALDDVNLQIARERGLIDKVTNY